MDLRDLVKPFIDLKAAALVEDTSSSSAQEGQETAREKDLLKKEKIVLKHMTLLEQEISERSHRLEMLKQELPSLGKKEKLYNPAFLSKESDELLTFL